MDEFNTVEEEQISEDEKIEEAPLEEPVNETENKDVSNKKKEEKKGNFFTELLIYLVLIILCVTLVPKYVVQRTEVDGSSMLNNLKNGDNLLVEKVMYRFKDPERFDIITLYPYGRSDTEDYYIKRIIGLPGERIQISGNTIYINGEILEEHYGREPIEDGGIAEKELTLGKDEYFVMGDNRNASKDSREEDVGTVKREEIDGHAVLRICNISKDPETKKKKFDFSVFGTLNQ